MCRGPGAKGGRRARLPVATGGLKARPLLWPGTPGAPLPHHAAARAGGFRPARPRSPRLEANALGTPRGPASPAPDGPRAALVTYSALRQAADVCQGMAVSWLLAAGTGSAAALGGASSLSVLPWLGLPLAGALGDRAPRRSVIRAADGAALLLAAGLAVLLLRRGLAVGIAYGWVLAYAALYALARPATKGLVREVTASPEGAASLSGALTAVEYAMLCAGQLLAALLLARGRGPAAFAATALLLAAGVAALSTARSSRRPPARAAAVPLPATALLLTRGPFRGPFVLTVACGACAFTLQVLAPLLALRHLHAGVLGFAVLAASGSAGSAAGALWLRRGARWRTGTRGVALAWLLAAPAAALAATTRQMLPAALAFAVLGAAAGFQDAGNAARVAALVPPEAQSVAMAFGSLVWRVPRLLAGGLAALGSLVPLGGLGLGLAATQAAIALGALALTAAPRRSPVRPS